MASPAGPNGPPQQGEDGPPQKFLCPISLEIMKDPVIIESGISFERRSIEQWFRAGNKTCPVSRKRVSSQVMIDNVFLKSEIVDWLEARGHRLGGPSPRSAPSSLPSAESAMHDPDGALRMLIELLDSPNEQLALQAAQQLCEVAEGTEIKTKLVQFGAVSPLIDLLSHGNHDIKEAAAAALWNISTGSDSHKVRIVQCGAVKELVRLLSSSRVQCQCAAAAALGTLATVEAHRREIGNAGALGPLANMLRSSSVVARETAAAAIWEIARNNKDNQGELVAKGAVAYLLRLLCTCDDFSKGSVAGALLTVAPTDEVRIQVVEAGAVPALVARLHADVGVDDGERTAEVLAQLVAGPTDTVAVLVVTAGAVGPIIQLLQSNRDRTKVIAAKALGRLAINDLNRDAIADCGGIPLMMELLRSSSPDCQAAAMDAMAALAQGQGYGDMLAEQGVLRPLVATLHGSNDTLKTSAARCLWALASKSDANQQRIARTGAISPLVQMLHSTVTDHRIVAATCLARLALNESNRNHIVDADAIPILVRLLRLKPPQTQERSAFCLWSISRGNPKAQKLIVKNQGLESLQHLLETGTPDCKRAAAGGLLVLSPKDKTRQQVYRNGAVPSMVSYLSEAEDDLSRELYADAITQVAFARCTQNLLIELGTFQRLEPYLQSPNPAVRMAAARAIKAIKGLITH